MKYDRNNLEAVIFDMDGVITNTMPDHFKAWKSVLNDEGVKVTHEDIYCREGQPGKISVLELFKKYGKTIRSGNVSVILNKKEQLFKQIVRKRFISGTRKLIIDIKDKGLKLGLVTGTARHELEKILPEQIKKLFDHIVTGDLVKYGKPHPEPYLKSIKALKIKPSNGLVIENAPFGIRSAIDAGLYCAAIETSLSREFLSDAHSVFNSIKDLRKGLMI